MKIKVLFICLLCASSVHAEPKVLGGGSKDSKSSTSFPGMGEDFVGKNFQKEPTYITSQSLTVESDVRHFVYSGNVKVVQADMTLTCDQLHGHYSEDSKIERLTALKNVEIIKGEKIKAHGQKAVYEEKTGIVTLTENPSLEQGQSRLEADVIKIFLNENRSVAEGTVRVKLANEGKEIAAAKPAAVSTPKAP